ncbi:MAG TPA: PEGA domain-containing protein [Blastocatellia bacterium]|nr:PEGA domain-containing protein [Blastocatellia bacterium]
MKLRPLVLNLLFLGLGLAMESACTPAPPANTNQSNINTNAAPSNSSQTKPTQQSNQSTTGTIEVSSVPPGARVLLISNDEGGAGEPQTKGLTPTTITDIQPGKYTVDLERPGYKFFQKEIVVKGGKTTKVSGTLKKQ